ncbi:hypothetical protein [Flavobacterium aquidurense]|uniref:Lipoprotein n=1 Tax=Flavobacterium aquidurense TaxID=362413 RepID=A0A0Q0Y1X0_9FLAO|nr:hypothetical protein [Flavobacterium aquidurense]KQB42742.1 hypothetical protein RC62_3749 [Flavobacterium aquidurense]
MKLKTIIIVLSLFCFPAISQNVKQDSCQLFFKEIGIRDFILGSNYTQFVKESKSLKRKFKKETVYGIEIVTFNEHINLIKQKRIVEYNLKFKNNIIMAYSFKMNIGNFRKGPIYYNEVLKLLQKNENKNNFIKGKGYNNIMINNTCKKSFGLQSSSDANYLYGGISYESPIWEQQFKDYLKATGQDR